MDRMQRGVEAASRSARKFMRANLSFAASHSYASPFFKRSTPRTDGIHSSVPDDAEKNLRRAEENVRPQFLSEENVRPQFLSAHADFRAQDHSDLVGTGKQRLGVCHGVACVSRYASHVYECGEIRTTSRPRSDEIRSQ